MLNISIIGGGPSINSYDHFRLSSFFENTFTIAINSAFKFFPHDAIMAQDPPFLIKEHEALRKDKSVKFFRAWRTSQYPENCRNLFERIPNCILLNNARSNRILTGILAIELAGQWLREIGGEGKIYLFGFDNKPNGHFHGDSKIPEHALNTTNFESLKELPCVNMCEGSSLTFWPTSKKLPDIPTTSLAERRDFLDKSLAWLEKRKYTTQQGARA